MKVAIYLRVANEDQAALTFQESWMKLWSAQQGHEIVDAFRDMMPGTSLERPGLQLLIRNLDSGHFEGVAVQNFDRLARGAELAHALTERFRVSGVRIVSPHETGNVFTSCFLGRQNKSHRYR